MLVSGIKFRLGFGFLFAIVGLLALSGGLPARETDAAAVRHIIVVGGIELSVDEPSQVYIGCSTPQSPDTWDGVISGGLPLYLQNISPAAVVYFSYNPDWKNDRRYDRCDTQQSIADSAKAFGGQFAAWRTAAGGAKIDIVAHSLGGVVVAYWLNNVASAADRAAVHSFVAFGSPLGGLSATGYSYCLFATVRHNVCNDLKQGSTLLSYLKDGVKRVPSFSINNTRDWIVNGTGGYGFSTDGASSTRVAGVWFSDTANLGGSCLAADPGCNHTEYFKQSSGAWLLPVQAYTADLIVDDLLTSRFSRGGPSGQCPAAGSNSKSWYWCWQTTCNSIGCPYAAHYWYTWNSTSGSDVNSATWKPNVPRAGDYWVCAYIPPDHAYTKAARYKIYYSGGSKTVVLNQQASYGWKSLGWYHFVAGTSGYIRLGDVTGEAYASTQIGFDAVKLVPKALSC